MNRSTLALISFGIILLAACSGSRSVTMNSMRPAEITFPSYVNTLLIVDRTKYKKDAVNIIEGVLTGELPGEDKAGLQEVVNAFRNQLTYSPRFQTKIATEILVGNSITSAFPNQLPWNDINRLCSKYQAEAVVAVEIFDTDFIVTDGKRKVKKEIVEDSVKKVIEVNEYYAQGVGNVTIGIRLYDPKAQSIVDQQLFRKTNTWEGKGTSVQDALLKLIDKGDATRYVSRIAGTNYAYKIAPMPVRITREFVGTSKKSPALESGTRYADIGKWQEAAEIWERGITSAPQKEAGYLCYNVGLAYEVLGDLDKAKIWAQRAYTEYGNKNAQEYVFLLDNRIYEEKRVKEQMQ